MSIPAPWCGKCHKYTRMLADDLRCPACHPLAGSTPPRAQHKPWCGHCDKATRSRFWGGRWWRCSDCHALGNPPAEWDKYRAPVGWREGMLVCDWMCYHSTTLLQVGPDGLYKLLRPFFDHGWCPADVTLALKQAPDGKPHISPAPTAGEAAKVGRWIANRLETWRGGDGAPQASPRRVREEAREKLYTEQAYTRQRYAAQEAARVDPQTCPAARHARQLARNATIRARGYSWEADAREAALRRSELACELARESALAALDEMIAEQEGALRDA